MRVPTYDGRQVNEAPTPGAYQNPGDYTIGARAAQQTADQLGAIADRVTAQQDQDFAWRADAKMKTDFATWEAANKPKFQGAAAAGTIDPTTGQPSGSWADQVKGYWAGQAQTFGQSLSPSQQRIIDRNIQMYSAATVGEAARYTMGELQKSHQEAWVTAKGADVQAALQAGTPAAAVVAADAIRTKNAQFGATNGHIDPATGQVDQNWLAAQNLHDLTGLHANMIAQLQQSDTAAARQYLTDHRGEIDGTQLDNIEKNLNTAEASTKAVQAVSDVFTKYLPAGADPSHGETPLNVTAMQADLEAQFKGNPVALAAARAELGSRVNAWKTTESQYQTDAINTIEAGVAQGRGLPWAMQQPAWGTLSGKSQAAITDHLDAKASAALGRADAAEARADRRLGREHFDLYLDLMSNPEKLAQLTPDQVKAYVPQIGDSLTRSLMEKRLQLNTAADTHKASLDAQAFRSIAVDMFDMKGAPGDPTASKDDKALYAQTMANVNFVLQQEQAAKKSPLTQQEKADIMTNELQRTVTVNPGWFSSNKQVPVIQLTNEQVGQVEITSAEWNAVKQKMQTRYAQTRDPAYEPTDANVRRWYLISKSPSGGRFSGQ